MSARAASVASRWTGSFLRWWMPLLVYMGFIFWMSSRESPELFREPPDYLLHFSGYFVLGVLALRAVGRGFARPRRRRSVANAVGLSFLYALSDEWHQSFVPARVASGWDVLADAAGIVAAAGGFLAYWRWWGQREAGREVRIDSAGSRVGKKAARGAELQRKRGARD